MGHKGIEEIWPEEFESYIDTHQESEYLLVDVRQPEEYVDEHIPGAKLIPLGKIDSRVKELPLDRDIIFYCGAGSRSRIAALMVAEQLETEAKLYSISGGIMAWESRLVHDLPKIVHFEGSGTVQELLYKAIELEKGAFVFYNFLTEKYCDHIFVKDLEPLAKAETAHARLVHGYLERFVPGFNPDFDEVFNNLKGDVIEGGLEIKDLMRKFDAFIERDLCLHVMETALDIEFSAYDLYKVMADKVSDKSVSEAFLSLAQAEKGHMKVIAKAIDRCSSKAGVE